jgi:predicted metalloprotease with PDZ domain
MLTYRLSFRARGIHHVDVVLEVTAREPKLELWMPAWTPGSYLIREFVRHLRSIRASGANGRELAVVRRTKARFSIACTAGEVVRVSYRIYANDLTVRTNYVTSDLALLNGAGTFFAVAGAERDEHRIEVELPQEWTWVTGLAPAGAGARSARDYATLIDCPLALGRLATTEFTAGGKPHRYAIAGPGNYDIAALADEGRRIIDTAATMFGPLPYDDYSILLYTTKDAQGGLEHSNSTVLAFPRFSFRDEKSRVDLATLVAHEHFHCWNVKSTKPREFVPYDMENETYTKALWICEGVTSYYDELISLRAGVMNRDVFLTRLGDELSRYFENAGRLEQDLEESSLTTWIRFYRQDEDYPNSAVSYYQKGALVALLLDLEIRHATNGARSLDDVMRAFFERYPRESQGYTPADFEALASEVAGRDLAEFFARGVRSTAELEFAESFARFGISFERAERSPAPSARDWIGVRIKPLANPLKIDVVERASAAESGGLLAGDELIAIEGMRAVASTLQDRLAECRGRRSRVTVFRDDSLVDCVVDVPAAASRVVKLKVDEKAAPDAIARRDAWLGAAPTAPVSVPG